MKLYSTQKAGELVGLSDQMVKKYCRDFPEIGRKLDDNPKSAWILTDDDIQKIESMKGTRGKKEVPGIKKSDNKIFLLLDRLDRAGGENTKFIQKIKDAATAVIKEITGAMDRDFHFSTGFKIIDRKLYDSNNNLLPVEGISRKAALDFSKEIADGLIQRMRADIEQAGEVPAQVFRYRE